MTHKTVQELGKKNVHEHVLPVLAAGMMQGLFVFMEAFFLAGTIIEQLASPLKTALFPARFFIPKTGSLSRLYGSAQSPVPGT